MMMAPIQARSSLRRPVSVATLLAFALAAPVPTADAYLRPMPSMAATTARMQMQKQRKTATALFYRDPIDVQTIATTVVERHYDESPVVAAASGKEPTPGLVPPPKPVRDPSPALPPFGVREVDRRNLHPVFKMEWVGRWMGMASLPPAAKAALGLLAAAASPVLLPLLPLYIAARKRRWKALAAASRDEHREAFEAATSAYRRSQGALVDELILRERERRERGGVETNEPPLPKVVAVTMATGQEGQGVVRSLSESPRFDGATILALCRNPSSAAARALAALPRVTVVKCDSTDPSALRGALKDAEAAFLCTTLNQANAGRWDMPWDGGRYQMRQGEAFAEACAGLLEGGGGGGGKLRHVVYGTAPVRKWPESFAVEPPIHYAAKWRVEKTLMDAGLPVTFLRKCPYHENFTKLTRARSRSDGKAAANAKTAAAKMGVQGGGAFVDAASRKVELERGTYEIKAFTPPDFTYNMMDPRDTGKWAVLAFSHPSVLVGESLSVASDALTGAEMARIATDCGALGDGVRFKYSTQPRWLFEALSWVESTFVYISGLQRWSSDGGVYDLDAEGVARVRALVPGSTWSDHLEREGLGQFTETMADLLPDITKRF